MEHWRKTCPGDLTAPLCMRQPLTFAYVNDNELNSVGVDLGDKKLQTDKRHKFIIKVNLSYEPHRA